MSHIDRRFLKSGRRLAGQRDALTHFQKKSKKRQDACGDARKSGFLLLKMEPLAESRLAGILRRKI